MVGTAVHERRFWGTGIARWQQGTTRLRGAPLVSMHDGRLFPLLRKQDDYRLLKGLGFVAQGFSPSVEGILLGVLTG